MTVEAGGDSDSAESDSDSDYKLEAGGDSDSAEWALWIKDSPICCTLLGDTLTAALLTSPIFIIMNTNTIIMSHLAGEIILKCLQ